MTERAGFLRVVVAETNRKAREVEKMGFFFIRGLTPVSGRKEARVPGQAIGPWAGGSGGADKRECVQVGKGV